MLSCILILTYATACLNDGRLGDNNVLEAIVNMKEPKGSDKAAIASYIEVFLYRVVCVCLSFYVQSHLASNNLLFSPLYNGTA